LKTFYELLFVAFENKYVERKLTIIYGGVVIAEAELVAIFDAVDRFPIEFQVIRIEVEAVHGIRVIGLPDTVFIEVDVTPDKVPDPESHFLVDEILELETLLLHPVGGHKNCSGASCA
jgi:hypothetical protein